MKKFSKIIASLLAVTIIMPGLGQKVVVADTIDVVRLAGANRVQTSIEVSKFAYATADFVVLAGANGGEVDALAGTLLAVAKNAPILLTLKDRVDPTLGAELRRLKVKTVYVLGGELTVGKKVEDELKKTYAVKRISGINREATAVAIAGEVNGQKKHIFLAKGYDILADALAIGPASALNDIPVLLTKSDKLPQTTLDALMEFGVTDVTIIGGEQAVSLAVENQLKKYKVDRISGSTREGTALAIANKYFKDSLNAVMANGYVFADALVGGYLAAKFTAPILLTNVNTIADPVINHLKSQTTGAIILGGTLAISEPVYNKIKAAVNATTPLTKVTITGKTIEGSELSALVEPAGANVSYQWKRFKSTPNVVIKDIPDATKNKYTTVEEDIGWTIRVKVTGVGKYKGSLEVNTVADIVECEFAGGSGTKADPYQVATAKQLDNVRYHLSEHFIQTADINLGVAPWNIGEGWEPIWRVASYTGFTGNYNGNFYKINGLTINRPDGDNQGLFGATEDTAELKNIGLENINIKGDSWLGGLVGVNKGTIEKCYTTGSTNGISHGGGLVGYNSGLITESYSSALVKLTGISGGGLVGKNEGSILNSYAAGSVEGQDAIGGLVGWNEKTIKNCYASSVSTGGDQHLNGLAGIIGNISDSYFDKDITILKANPAGRTTQQMTTKATFINWNFDEIWSINTSPESYPYLKWQNNRNIPYPKTGFAGGSGTVSDPYKVATFIQLHRVRYYLDKHFIQTADIKMVNVYGTEDWEPITVFSGSYNGNGKKIEELTIDDNAQNNFGLFGKTGVSAKLSNIELTGVSIQGTDRIGSLVITNLGTIENCSAKGSIIGCRFDYADGLGGLVCINEGLIDKCSTAISVSLGGANTGGLVGVNKGTINSSYSLGTVDGNINTGGLVGRNQGFIANTYAKGTVTGLNNVGGLVGRSDEFNSSGKAAYINLSYATGKVAVTNTEGQNYVAGIVGYNDGLVQRCYYDKQTTTCNDKGKGDPKSTADMCKKGTFDFWDFTNTWQINTSPPSYPYFQWQGTTP